MQSVVLTRDDLNNIKLIANLCTIYKNCWICFTSDMVNDASGNSVIPGTYNVMSFLHDRTSPELLEYIVDMNEGFLLLTFDEVVDADSFVPSELTLLNDDASSSLNLTAGKATRSSDGLKINFTLTEAEHNAVKAKTDLYTSITDSFLIFGGSLVQDVSGNNIRRLATREQAKQYVADTTRPFVSSFAVVNLTAGSLSLLFSEPVNISSGDVETISIVSLLYNDEYALTGGRLSYADETKQLIEIFFTRFDRRNIKLNLNLSTSEEDTYVTVTNKTIKDFSENYVLPITLEDPLRLRSGGYIPDTSPPALERFSLDMNKGSLELTFNDVVDIASADPAQITLHGDGNVSYSLVNSSVLGGSPIAVEESGSASGSGLSPQPTTSSPISDDDGYVVTVLLGSDDLNAIKLLTDLATSRATTYLSHTKDLVKDIGRLPVVPGSRLLADVFVQDVTSPELLLFDLDLDSGLVKMKFDEPVNPFHLRGDRISIWNKANGSSSHAFIGGSPAPNSTAALEITLVMKFDDVNALKSDLDLATGKNSTYLSLSRGVVRDINGNLASEVPPLFALQVSNFTEDTSRPRLVAFELDLNTNFIKLSFSEAVDLDTFDVLKLTLQNERAFSFDTVTYTLTGARKTQSLKTNSIVQIFLNSLDAQELKREDFPIAKSRADSFLTFGSDLVRDFRQYQVVPVNESDAVQASVFQEDLTCTGIQAASYVVDRTSPRLQKFDVDMTNGTLTLYFSETVDVSTFRFDGLTLVDTDGLPDFQHSIRQNGSILTTIDGPILTVALHKDDLNAIKRDEDLFDKSSTSHLVLEAATIQDMSDNLLFPVGAIDAIKVSVYKTDVVSPELSGFSIDLSNNNLTLTFDEPVDIDSFEPRAITLQNAPIASRNYTLTGAISQTISADGLSVEIKLLVVDANSLKSFSDFATSPENTWITMTSDLVTDVSRGKNRASARLSGDRALNASAFSPDRVMPTVLQFSLLDMDAGKMRLLFDEPVNKSSLKFELLTLQSTSSGGTKVTLNGGLAAYVDSDVKTELEISITKEDLKILKLDSSIATRVANSFVAVASGAVLDMNGNMVRVVRALSPVQYVADTTGPLATFFHLDMDEGTLELTFDDVVRRSTLQPDKISLESSPDKSSAEFAYQLTRGGSSSPDGYTILIQLSKADVDEIKHDPQLATSSLNTFISLTAEVIEDVAGNNAVPIVRDSALYGNFTPDETPPFLSGFSLDMDAEGHLVLSFSETVDRSTINLTAITLYSEKGGVFSLTGGSFIRATVSHDLSVDVTLTPSDMNSLKANPGLATFAGDTQLLITSALVKDMAGNDIVFINSSSPLDVSVFTPDRTQPVLLSYDLDLDSGKVRLTFDEVVNSSSLNPTGISFQDLQGFTANVYTLTDGTQSTEDATEIELLLTIDDLNGIKRAVGLAASEETTYMTMTEITVRDMMSNFASNPVSEVTVTEAIHVTNYTYDTTNPRLTGFSLNMSTAEVAFAFDETVNVSSLDIKQILFQSSTSLNSSLAWRRLTTGGLFGSSTSSFDGTVIVVNIGSDDLNEIKRILDLCTRQNNTYVSFTHLLIRDMAGNSVTFVNYSRALRADVFYPDRVRPQLVYYDLDMSAKILTFLFTETMRVSSLDVTQLRIQYSNVTGAGASRQLTNVSEAISEDGTVVRIAIGPEDFNEITRQRDLATEVANTFLLMTKNAIDDMNENKVIELEDGINALKVRRYRRDVIPPNLAYFDLDIDRRLLTIVFDETVDVSLLTISEISLHATKNETSGKYSYTLTSSSTSASSDGTIVEVLISEGDMNAIKRIPQLARQANDTHISMTTFVVSDIAGNLLVPVTVEEAARVASFTPDATGPYLRTFDFDVDSGILTLTFDETVNVSTFIPSRLTVHTDNAGGAEVNVTDGRVLTNNSHVVLLELPQSDLDRIKLLTNLAVSLHSTNLTIRANSIWDTALRPNPGFWANLRAAAFIPDVTPPEVIEFRVDVNHGTLTLLFNEAVDADTFNATGISVQNAMTSSVRVDLTGGNTPSSDGVDTIVNLTQRDLNEIKRIESLLVNESTSYLVLLPKTIKDMNGNPVVAVPNGKAFKASSFINDTTRPSLRQFDLDMNRGSMTMRFSETMDISTVDFTGFTMQRAWNSTIRHTLTGGVVLSQTDSTSVAIEFTLDDLNSIKALQVGDSPVTAWLTVEANGIRDMNGRFVLERKNGYSALRATAYEKDVTNPVLQYFNLSINSGELVMHFSETVNGRSFDALGVWLQGTNRTNAVDEIHQLKSLDDRTGTNTLYSPDVVVSIGLLDLNEIKRLTALATGTENTFLSLFENAIADMQGNQVIRIPYTSALQVLNFVSDTSRPELERFDLDIDEGLLRLHFSETVDSFTLDMKQIRLQNSRIEFPSNSSAYQFTGGLITFSEYPSASLEINITEPDLNEIKRLHELGTSDSTSWLSLASAAIEDMNRNDVIEISNFDALPVSEFTPDTTEPILLHFDVDLSLELLTLYFSETVNASSLDIRQITLQDNATRNVDFTLTRATTLSEDSTVIRVRFFKEDLHYVKQFEGLFVSHRTSYLVATKTAIADMNSNLLVAIDDGQAQQVRNYVSDTVRPRLLAFELDMDSATLTLTFDETINVTSLNISELLIRPYQSADDSVSHRLQPGLGREFSVSVSENWPVIDVNLGDKDMNDIKRLTHLATSEANTYLTLTERAVVDMMGNRVWAINTSAALLTTNFTEDTTEPTLIRFDMDVDAGEFTLLFSETVNVSSFSVRGVTIQNRVNASAEFVRLTEGDVLTRTDELVIRTEFSFSDLNAIKKLRDLATDRNNTFLSILYGAVKDMNGNKLTSVTSDMAERVSSFTDDTTPPELESYAIDMDSGQLLLTFSEIVEADSFNSSALTLQGDRNLGNETEWITLLGGVHFYEDSILIVLNFSIGDLNAIKKFRNLSTDENRNDTFLSATTYSVRDMRNNELVAILPTNAQRVATFTPDTTAPFLERFNLDLDAGLLNLTFSETVDSLTFRPSGITLQHRANRSEESIYYTGPLERGPFVTLDGTQLSYPLVASDLNRIKQLPELAVSQNSTFIALTNLTVRDMNSNFVVDVPATDGIKVTSLVPDTTSPELVSFDLDMDSGLINMSFSETVNVSTIDATAISLQNNGSSLANVFYTITLGSASTGSFLTGSTSVELYISLADLNELKRQTGLATSQNNSYITLTPAAIRDMNGNRVAAVERNASVRVSLFIPDTTSPALESFDVDLTEETLTLHFDETVNSSSFDLEQFVFQDAVNRTYYRWLTGGSILSEDNSTIVVQLDVDDLHYIKSLPDLLTTTNSTYLAFTSDALLDMNKNRVAEILTTAPKRVGVFREDERRPDFVGFDLDMNTARLTLTFAETVNVSSLDVGEIVIQSAQLSPVEWRRLQSGNTEFDSESTSPDWPIIVVNIGHDDMNSLKKQTSLATSNETTFIALTRLSIQDMNGNVLNPVLTTNAISVTSFTPDTTEPELKEFNISLDAGEIVLTFSETVNISSLNLTLISLQNDASNATSTVSLTGGDVITEEDGLIALFRFSEADLNLLKFYRNLATDSNNTFISVAYGTVLDMNGNKLTAIGIDNAIPVRGFEEDETTYWCVKRSYRASVIRAQCLSSPTFTASGRGFLRQTEARST